jgi:hypothetical protein
LSAFSVQFGPWNVFCMTTGGMHDNGKGAPSPHLSKQLRGMRNTQGDEGPPGGSSREPVLRPHKMMAYCGVLIHLCTLGDNGT